MKALVNPLVLLVLVILLACRFHSETLQMENTLDWWLLSIAVTALIVNGILALSRALAHRPSLMLVVWSVVYLILSGSFVCYLSFGSSDVSGEEQAAFQSLYDAWQNGGDPHALDEGGDCLLVLAASLGRDRVVREVLEHAPSQEQLVQAACAAADRNRERVLKTLLDHGVSPSAAWEGSPLIVVAAEASRPQIIRLLLDRGADVNARDAAGNTPLMQAAHAENIACVKLLMSRGADPSLQNEDGATAADFCFRESVRNLLSPEN